mmetsp:Transcript_49060/g.147765  ORF Transcript_49060/g.147765 Transcript_49060/m.147765 type:complete len:383 (-) Transcript_49060:32-1180(-)
MSQFPKTTLDSLCRGVPQFLGYVPSSLFCPSLYISFNDITRGVDGYYCKSILRKSLSHPHQFALIPFPVAQASIHPHIHSILHCSAESNLGDVTGLGVRFRAGLFDAMLLIRCPLRHTKFECIRVNLAHPLEWQYIVCRHPPKDPALTRPHRPACQNQPRSLCDLPTEKDIISDQKVLEVLSTGGIIPMKLVIERSPNGNIFTDETVLEGSAVKFSGALGPVKVRFGKIGPVLAPLGGRMRRRPARQRFNERFRKSAARTAVPEFLQRHPPVVIGVQGAENPTELDGAEVEVELKALENLDESLRSDGRVARRGEAGESERGVLLRRQQLVLVLLAEQAGRCAVRDVLWRGKFVARSAAAAESAGDRACRSEENSRLRRYCR